MLGILRGVMLAVVATLLMGIARASKPAASVRGRRPGTDEFVDLERHPDARAVPGVLVYRIDQPLVYFNVDHVRDDVVERVRAASPRPRLVVLELSLSPRLDLAAVNMLGELEEQLRLLGASSGWPRSTAWPWSASVPRGSRTVSAESAGARRSARW